MPLTAGTRLGPYEIVSPVGEGGMGEVYRARDTRLGRDVALKVLPPSFSADPDRLRRFEQEACAAGALNHPNIVVVHDVGSDDGSSYVVSELLEGETLREQLTGTALSRRKAIDYALQIANGLAAAHEKSIVHRDLKPENIFVTGDGRVKILDFGIAKLLGPKDGGEAQTDLPTMRLNTNPGAVVGTVGYMSPEQVRGQRVDHRSDIFSFGAVLYEMLTGRRAFQGESAVETLNAILKEEPPELSATNRHIGPALERVVRHCLEKNPGQRFHSASDLAFALESLVGATGPISTSITPPIQGRIIGRERLAWVAAAVLFLVALALALHTLRRAPAETQAIRFAVHPPEKATFSYFEENNTFSLAPNGQGLAFTATAEGRTLLYVRPLGALAAQPLAGTDGASSPFWSPDSRLIAFLADGKLKRIEAAGGTPPQTICELAGRSINGTWNREGVIVFSVMGGSYGIYRVPATGGAATRIIDPTSTQNDSRRRSEPNWPQFLPDGRHFLYRAWGADREAHVYVRALDSEDDRVVVNASSLAMYAAPGYLLYVREGTLLAQPFDAAGARPTGEPSPVAEQLRYFNPTGNAAFWASENGVLAYQSGVNVSRLEWFDRSGQGAGQVGSPGEYGGLRLSPDGQRAVVGMRNPRSSAGTHDLWVYELAHNTPTRFTTDIEGDDTEWWPIWSPDGRRIVFSTDVGGPPHLYQKGLSDTGGGEALLPVGGNQIANDWSPDGRHIVYEEGGAGNRMDLWMLPLYGDRRPRPFLQTPFSETQAQFSPDGRWLAYVSDESGNPEVYVQPFEGSGERRRVSHAGGSRPRWRRDGKELFYLAADGRLMAVPSRAGTSFEAGQPVMLFNTAPAVWRDYDVTADGQRFLCNIAATDINSLPITVAVNWMADLKR